MSSLENVFLQKESSINQSINRSHVELHLADITIRLVTLSWTYKPSDPPPAEHW